jgi:hypothetical protein
MDVYVQVLLAHINACIDLVCHLPLLVCIMKSGGPTLADTGSMAPLNCSGTT